MTRPRRIAVVTGSRADYGLLRGILDATARLPMTSTSASSPAACIWCRNSARPGAPSRPTAFRSRRRIDLQLDDDRAETVARGTGIGACRLCGRAAEACAGRAGRARRPLRNPVGRGRRDAVEHSDRAHPWRRGHRRRLRRCDPPRHHQDGLPAFRRGRALSAPRHPDGRESGLRLQCRRARPRSRERKRPRSAAPNCLRNSALGGPERFLLVTLHPTTARPEADAANVAALLGALAEIEDRSFVFTGVNADPGYRAIDDAIRAFVAARPNQAQSVRLARQRALLGRAAACGRRGRQLLERHRGGAGRRRPLDQYRRPPAGPAARRLDHRLSGRSGRHSRGAQGILDGRFRVDPAATPPYGRGGASEKIAGTLRKIDLQRRFPEAFP